MSDAISDSSDAVLRLAAIMPGYTILAFYIALLRLAKTMEGRWPELRTCRDAVLGDSGEAN